MIHQARSTPFFFNNTVIPNLIFESFMYRPCSSNTHQI